MSSKLTQDDKEEFLELVTAPGMTGLLHELRLLVESQERDVFRIDLATQANDRALILAKSRAEGARRLFVAFEARLGELRDQQLGKPVKRVV